MDPNCAALGGDLENSQCPICFYDYTSTGDSAPHMLPCAHTLCLKCI